MEFTVRNFERPNLTIEVTDAGYRIDGRRVPPDIAWLFDRALLDYTVPLIFDSLIDVYVSGTGHACRTNPSDVLDVEAYVRKYWELEPC